MQSELNQTLPVDEPVKLEPTFQEPLTKKVLNVSDSGFFDAPEIGVKSRVNAASMNELSPLRDVPPADDGGANLSESKPKELSANMRCSRHSGVDVVELCNGSNTVMRRKPDGFVNATHVLKMAGVPKVERTRILEQRLQNCAQHDKVQGGFVRYQGTWVPCEVALELAQKFGVEKLLMPLLSMELEELKSLPSNVAVARSTTVRVFPKASSLGQSLLKSSVPRKFPAPNEAQPCKLESTGRSASVTGCRKSLPLARVASVLTRSNSHSNPVLISSFSRKDNSPQGLRKVKLLQELKAASWTPCSPFVVLKLLTGISNLRGPGTLCSPTNGSLSQTSSEEESSSSTSNGGTSNRPSVADIATPLDDEENTALHLAAACGQLSLVDCLCDLLRTQEQESASYTFENLHGLNPLSYFVSTAFQHNEAVAQCCKTIIALFNPFFLRSRDTKKSRTILHHLMLKLGGKTAKSTQNLQQYATITFETLKQSMSHEELQTFVNTQDVGGNTALHYALQTECQQFVRALLLWGANVRLQNHVGSSPYSIAMCSSDSRVKKWMVTCYQAGNDASLLPTDRKENARVTLVAKAQPVATREKDKKKALLQDVHALVLEYMHHFMHDVKDKLTTSKNCLKQIKWEKRLLEHYIKQYQQQHQQKSPAP